MNTTEMSQAVSWEKRDAAKIEILEGLKAYWGERSESYSALNIEEMEDFRRDAWKKLILEKAPGEGRLRILDVGTGPGFFAINLALEGHEVTGVDVTEEMLACAEKNAAQYDVDVSFVKYDGSRLPFEEGTFDLVVSRNVLWNIERPGEALKEWNRVVRPGGRLVYFDANWYRYLFDEEQRVRFEETRRQLREQFPDYAYEPLGSEKNRYLEELARRLPLSKEIRPAWDVKVLADLGMRTIDIDIDITDTVYTDCEKIEGAASPLFRICAQK